MFNINKNNRKTVSFKIFLSYTLRDENLNKDILNEFKKSVTRLKNIDLYIDIIDNKNYDDPQREVYRRLEQAGVVWKINSVYFEMSKWAVSEINTAQKCGKPIFYFDLKDVDFIINIGGIYELRKYIKKFLPLNNNPNKYNFLNPNIFNIYKRG